jgi:hypothetical protein
MLKKIYEYLLLVLSCGAAVFAGCSAKKPANGLFPFKFLTDSRSPSTRRSLTQRNS